MLRLFVKLVCQLLKPLYLVLAIAAIVGGSRDGQKGLNLFVKSLFSGTNCGLIVDVLIVGR
jgi:hypothetical protein